MTVNKDGSVSVTMKNGNTMTSAAGSVGKGTMLNMAAGAMSKLGPSSVNMGNLAKALGTKNPNTRNNVSEHDVKNHSDPNEPTDVSNNTSENSDFASHISVHRKGNRTDVTINLTMSWNRLFTKKMADLARGSIEKYWNGTVKSDGQIYTIRTKITEVGADPLIGDVRGQIDLQPCIGCSLLPGAVDGKAYVGSSTIYAVPSILEAPVAFAHEFGHDLGLHHQWNETGDIMSYARERHLTAWDIKQVASTYGGE